MGTSAVHCIPDPSGDAFERLPLGSVRLDERGRVTSYPTRGTTPGVRDPKAILGREFFGDVVPHEEARALGDRFRDGVAGGLVSIVFHCRFLLRDRAPEVTITAFFSSQLGSGWAFVREGR